MACSRRSRNFHPTQMFFLHALYRHSLFTRMGSTARVIVIVCLVLSLFGRGNAQQKVIINNNYPIENPGGGPTLSPPHVDQTNECATKVRVDSFIPHATINVYLTSHGTYTLIGSPITPFFGFTAVTLTSALHVNDQVVATQTVNGVTSAYSQVMKVGAMPSHLADPDVQTPVYACGVIVPVTGLTSGVTVDVQDKTSSTIVGTDSTPNAYFSGGWDPVGTSSLNAPPTAHPAHEVRAKQSACTGVHSNYGPTQTIDAEPSPVLPPTVEPPIVNNDAVTLDGLYVGAAVQVKDGSTPDGSGDATASTNWIGLSHTVTAASVIKAEQKLRSASKSSAPVNPTTTIPPPTLVSPICPGQTAAYVDNSTINATLVLLHNGTTVIGYGGAAPGEVPLDIAPPATFTNGEDIQVAEYLGSTVVLSNSVVVGCSSTAKVIDMIPISLSAETNQDSEPFLAINGSNSNLMVGSAFTNAQPRQTDAPLYVSQDGGNTWTVNYVVPVAPYSGFTDITNSFAGSGTYLYTGRLRNCPPPPSSCPYFASEFEELDTSDATSSSVLNQQAAREQVDQPFTRATTVGGNDRIYIGNNDFNNFASSSQTASIDVSSTGGSSYNTIRIDSRSPSGQDGPSIRPSFAKDGTVYAAFFSWLSQSCAGCNVNNLTSDVVVVRDDSGGTGSNPFQALTDPSDGNVGLRVVQGVPIAWSNQLTLGQERTGSTLSLAVDPNNSSRVFIVWADNNASGGAYTIHVRSSSNKGLTWSSSDLFTVQNALNVALAIANNGTVGLLYQQHTGKGTASDPWAGKWVTHLAETTGSFKDTQDTILAQTPSNTPANQFLPYLGDYLFLMAVGNEFRGVFCANNTPNVANFPQGVVFQRVANFSTQTLETPQGASVPVSIDPFYFSVPATKK